MKETPRTRPVRSRTPFEPSWEVVTPQQLLGFEFLVPGQLLDCGVELVLGRKVPVDLGTGYLPAYEFDIIDRASSRCAGYLHFRVALNQRLTQCGGHIGYGVHPEFRGKRYAARCCKLLFPFVRRHGIRWVLVTCNPDNIPSRRTCELIGGVLIGTMPVEVEPGTKRMTSRYIVDLATLSSV